MAQTPGVKTGVLRHLRHLDPPTKGKLQRPRNNIANHVPAFVQPKDRIAFWNIVPGDYVRLRTGDVGPSYGLDPSRKWRGEGRVVSIDRERNLAWLVNTVETDPRAPRNIRSLRPRLVDPMAPEKGFTPSTMEVPRAVHYSNLQLKLPDRENTYAVRLLCQEEPRYDWKNGLFRWKRVAIYRGQDGSNQKTIVPWPRNKPNKTETTDDAARKATIQEETWLPWNRNDPVYIEAEETLVNSPASEKQVSEQLEKLALKAASQPELPTGGYAGFRTRKSVKPPPIPQPPTAAEVISHDRDALSQWASSPALKDHVAAGGRSFTPSDYLGISPLMGPAAGGNWRLPVDLNSTRTLNSESYYERDPVTGQLTALTAAGGNRTSKTHLDGMPIELMMQDDLINIHSRARKMRRRKERRSIQVQENKRLAKEEKERVDLFKKVVNAKVGGGLGGQVGGTVAGVGLGVNSTQRPAEP